LEKLKLGELLVRLGKLTPEQLSMALEEQQRRQEPLGQVLLQKGWIRESELYQVLADQQRAPLISLEAVEIQPEALNLLDRRFAREKQVLPLRLDGARLHVAMAHPADLALLDELRFRTGKEIVPYLASDREILQTLDDLLQPQQSLDAVQMEARPGPDLTLEQAPAIELADELVRKALGARASDLHLEPQESYVRVRIRVDGVLQEIHKLDKGLEAPLVARFKVLAGMDIAEKRRPQDGHFTYTFGNRRHELRIASVGTLFGERLTVRIIYPNAVRRGLTDLGMLPEDLKRFEGLLRSTSGILLVTGPTGSGKTTTLYAAMQHLYTSEKCFLTIEDPVEVPLEGISQIPVQPKIDLDFGEALRSVLRQDPDVILVGEIRDRTTIDTALRAALTGHLVLATLHANDALSTPIRLLEMGAEPYLVGATLLGVVAQRLVRQVCPQCAEACPTPPEARLLWGEATPTHEYRGQGCAYCRGTGFSGRMGLYEIYSLDQEARHLIASGGSLAELQARAASSQHKDLWAKALVAVRDGRTTTSEVLRALGWREV